MAVDTELSAKLLRMVERRNTVSAEMGRLQGSLEECERAFASIGISAEKAQERIVELNQQITLLESELKKKLEDLEDELTDLQN